MSYRYLVDNTNRIYSLLSDAAADADVYPERARDNRIRAAFLACDTFNRLLYDSDFQQSLEDCHAAFLQNNNSIRQILSTDRTDESIKMLRDFLNAERQILIVAGMNEEAASYLLDFENVASILDFANDPLEHYHFVDPALRNRREETCQFAKSLQEERKREDAERRTYVLEARQQQQEARSRKFKRRILNGIGGAALVTVNTAVGTGLSVVSAGTTLVVAGSLIALSGSVGGALISEAVQQQL